LVKVLPDPTGGSTPHRSQLTNFDRLNTLRIYRKALDNKSNIRVIGKAEAILSGRARATAKPYPKASRERCLQSFEILPSGIQIYDSADDSVESTAL
jgi:hypothetical protein